LTEVLTPARTFTVFLRWADSSGRAKMSIGRDTP